MHQYFEDNRDLETNRKEIPFRFWCLNYTFMSDNGVFSKGEIDHGSRILLETILTHEQSLHKVLDLGCGYGVIGIVLKKQFSDCEVEAVDVNERAIDLARTNALLNKVEISVYKSNALTDVKTDDFKTIVLNPPIRAGKKVIYEMFEGSYEHLCSGGCLWIVIRKQHGAASAAAKLLAIFGNCELIKKDKGYYVYRAIKH